MKKSGFTLIELVVVLALIGLIIGIAIVGINGSQANSRDTARKDFMQNLNAQLLLWYQKNSSYPSADGTTTGFYGTGSFIDTASTISCPNGVVVNSRCIGTSGLTLHTPAYPTSQSGCSIVETTVKSNSIDICYIPNIGTDGYTLMAALENQTLYKVAY